MFPDQYKGSMSSDNKTKIGIEEIRTRFDNDVERFSNSETGQASVMDGALALDIVEKSIFALHPDAQHVCDIGCGAGNFTLRVLKKIPHVMCTLVDVSSAMLERAQERIVKAGGIIEDVHNNDIRVISLKADHFDVVIAAAVLHHLRSKQDWEAVLTNIYASLKNGGTFWIWDLIRFDNDAIESIQRKRYAEYLTSIEDKEYQEKVFEVIENEDSPESTSFITRAMLKVGFAEVDIVHKNGTFAVIYGKK